MATKRTPSQQSINQPSEATLARQTNALKIKIDHLKTFDPLTENQKIFYDNYNRKKEFFLLYGCAGTGKSWICLYKALEDVLSKDTPYKKLIIIRSDVPSRNSGFLKGSLEEKMQIYKEPYIAICADLFGRSDAFQRLEEQGAIVFCSTAYLRGMTFNDSIVFFDEFQNETWHNCRTILSRVGTRTKLILAGDFRQTDLNKTRSERSGFSDLLKVINHMDNFVQIEFTHDDIVRSGFCKDFIIACDELGL